VAILDIIRLVINALRNNANAGGHRKSLLVLSTNFSTHVLPDHSCGSMFGMLCVVFCWMYPKLGRIFQQVGNLMLGDDQLLTRSIRYAYIEIGELIQSMYIFVLTVQQPCMGSLISGLRKIRGGYSRIVVRQHKAFKCLQVVLLKFLL
jgi:hypothetical protein